MCWVDNNYSGSCPILAVQKLPTVTLTNNKETIKKLQRTPATSVTSLPKSRQSVLSVRTRNSSRLLLLAVSVLVAVVSLLIAIALFSVLSLSHVTLPVFVVPSHHRRRNPISTIMLRHASTTRMSLSHMPFSRYVYSRLSSISLFSNEHQVHNQRHFVTAFTLTKPRTHLHRSASVTASSMRLRQPWRVSKQYPSHADFTCSKQQQCHMSTQNQETSTTINHDSDDNYYDPSIFDDTVTDFASLGIKSKVLLQRLHQQQLYRPTKVQIASYPVIAASFTSTTDANDNEPSENFTPTDSSQQPSPQHTDVTIACETGSGKTLAYLLPLIDDILQRKSAAMSRMPSTDGSTDNIDASKMDVGYDYARAIILVPNKELVQQVVRMAAPLSGGARHSVIYGGHTLPDPSIFDNHDDTNMNNNHSKKTDDVVPLPQDIVRIAIMPGGLGEPLDFLPFRKTVALGGGTQPPIDLLISTPASIGPLALSPKHIAFFADIETIVVDEADMLLDGGYIRALENVLMGFKRADRLDVVKFGDVPKTQHVFVAATLPNYGLRSVDAYLSRKFPNSKRIELDSLHMARHSGLVQPTVWMEMESKKDRMMKLVELFQSTSDDNTDSLRNEKVMVFLNSVADCEASCEALQRAGIHCAPYHAQIPLSDRTAILDRFRRYNVNDIDNDTVSHDDASPVPVLVCTDLASRGLDVPGVSVVVQLQFCGNVVGHLHRMGRCGRGGNQRHYGRGYVFYGMKERALVETVKAAELEQEQMVLPGDVVTKDWDSHGDDVVTEDSSNKDPSLSINKEESVGNISTMGKVTTAFSRKRGFTKKLKKLRRSSGDDEERDEENI